MEWSDLKYLLAVTRTGSLAAASRELGVDQTTVGRRLQALEQQIGSQLFNRIDRRWVPTSAGASAARLAEKIESEVLVATSEIRNQDASLEGKVRLTSLPMVIDHLLAPRIGRFVRDFPTVELEMVASSKVVSLRHLEADIAVRLSRPKDPSAVARKLTTISYQVFASKWAMRSADRLPWVGFDQTLNFIPEEKWIRTQPGGDKPMVRVGSYEAMATILTSTPGRALLPSVLARRYPDIVAVSGHVSVLSRGLWLVYMKDVRRIARIVAVAGWISEACHQDLPIQ